MFRKVASTQRVGLVSLEDGFVRSAAPMHSRYLQDGARQLDFGGLLERAAANYAISTDPRDYLFEVIRANTTNAPNENCDAFQQSELLRYDLKLGVPVYGTYAGKPHLIEHHSEKPKAARGIIVDASYNNDAPALPQCPCCTSDMRERSARDESGLHCRKCGVLVKDEFVEILLGIDTKKDPIYAAHVKSGKLKSGSMGCNCMNTQCNVCGHIAFSKPEFCSHIKMGNKGTLWVKKSSQWTKTNSAEVQQLIRKTGFKFVPANFCYFKHGNLEIRRAYEHCQNVVFDEYSRVEQPADPKALQEEVLQVYASVTPTAAELAEETAGLLRATAARKTAMHYVVVRVNGDSADCYAVPCDEGQEPESCVAEAKEMADVSPEDTVEWTTVEAEDVAEALDSCGSSEWHASGMDQEGDKITVQRSPEISLNVVPDEEGAPGGVPSEMPQPGAPGEPGVQPMDIEQLQGQPPERTPAEMGMESGDVPGSGAPAGGPQAPRPPGGMVPGGSAPRRGASMNKTEMPFRQAYEQWTVEVTEQGNAVVKSASKKPVLVVRGGVDALADRRAFGIQVLAHLFEHGLVKTAMKMNGVFAPRAQTLEHGTSDIPREDKLNSVLEGGVHDMADVDRANATPETVLDGGADSDDMAGDVRGKPPSDTREDETDDFGGRETPPKSVLQDGQDVPRRTPPKDVLEGGTVDHEMGFTATVGQRLAHKQLPQMTWEVVETNTNSAVVTNGTSRRRISHKDLGMYWTAGKAPAKAKKADAKEADIPKVAEPKSESKSATVDASVAETRMRRLIEARTASLKQEAEATQAKAVDAAIDQFVQAMRVVAKRQEADLEQSPLKMAAEAVLGESRAIGTDAATGEPMVFPGLEPSLTKFLTAQLYQVAHNDHITHLAKRAKELMKQGPQYLASAEADAKNLRPQLPTVTASVVLDNSTVVTAMSLRRAAMDGNMPVAPGWSEGNGTSKRDLIREAVAHTAAATRLPPN